MLLKFSLNLNCSVIAMEYPGYGIYKTEESDAEKIMLNAHLVFQYLTKVLKYKLSDIILIGRSMGSGPACTLAAKYKDIPALILISPFTSLKNAVKSLLGSFPSLLVKERFDNLTKIKQVACPTLLIHGQGDTIVPYQHSLELHEHCGGPSKLILPHLMTHNEFTMKSDIIMPLQ
jgi:fermentation-respiration switch protein FrsA (DUF1100 family)